jgi:hypothetical protein
MVLNSTAAAEEYVTFSSAFLAWAAADSRDTNHDYAG